MAPSPTVLIVEDDTDLANLYATWLTDEYDVRTAYSGKRGLEKFDSSVDLVLLDRRMPNYSGDEVLEDVRSHEHTCPVMMLTAVDLDVEAVDLPFDEYLVKPVSRERLRDNVQRLLTRAQSEHNTEVLTILGDQKSRHCLSYLTDTAATAKEVANATGYSLPTVYRRLNSLQQAGLIEGRTRIDSDGNHVKTFTTVAEQVLVDIADGFQIEVESASEQ